MLGSYICRQCSLRLSRRIRPLRHPQWQPRATYLSFNEKKTKTDAETPEAESRPQRQQEFSQDGRHNGPTTSYTFDGPPLIRPGTGRYSKLTREDSRRGIPTPTYADATKEVEGAASETQLRTGHAVYIERALMTGHVDAAWRSFKKNYTSRDCEALTNPSPSDVELLKDGKIFTNLLSQVTTAFCDGDPSMAITPTVVLFEYEKLGFARPECWANRTMGYLTHRVVQAVNGTTDQPGRDLPALLFELLSVWRLFFQCKGENGKSLDSISTEWHLPATEAIPDMHPSHEFNMRLQDYHPKYIGSPALSFCAVYLYTMSDALNSVEPLQQQAAPLLQFFERLLAGSSVHLALSHTNAFPPFLKLPKDVQRQIKDEINDAPRKALVMIGSKGTTGGSKVTAEEAAANLEEFQLKRIAHAIESRGSADTLSKIWTQAEKTYTSEDQKIAIPLRVYNAFLAGFLILRSADRSVQVWNHMIANGVHPDMQSWVALLDGCAKAKDLDGFNAMWERLLNTGQEPDNHAWTARVNGLISLRQANLGLAALDDMGKRWLSAETVINTPQTHGKNRKGPKNLAKGSKAVNKCTKPSVEVINGAITALIQNRSVRTRTENIIATVGKILGWASHFGIKPDVRTYNALIRIYMQAGDTATAYKLLRQMEKDGIPGDEATHTMLITAAFDNNKFDNLSHSEQTARILSMFDQMEAGGLTPNAYAYSIAIDRLLKQYSNDAAVGVIIEHMTARNQVPRAQIYTSLISHYFQQSPPAIAAVENLVQETFNNHRLATDRILFDRVLEGYAEHGEVSKMMGVATRMSAQGRQPGWRALTVVVEALVKAGDLDRARGIVRDVERGEGLAKGGLVSNRAAENKFLSMARSFGLASDQQLVNDSFREQEPRHMTLEDTLDEVLAPGMYASDAVDYEPESSRPERESQTRRTGVEEEQEEDVHGFLVDEPEPNKYQQAQRP